MRVFGAWIRVHERLFHISFQSHLVIGSQSCLFLSNCYLPSVKIIKTKTKHIRCWSMRVFGACQGQRTTFPHFFISHLVILSQSCLFLSNSYISSVKITKAKTKHECESGSTDDFSHFFLFSVFYYSIFHSPLTFISPSKRKSKYKN